MRVISRLCLLVTVSYLNRKRYPVEVFINGDDFPVLKQTHSWGYLDSCRFLFLVIYFSFYGYRYVGVELILLLAGTRFSTLRMFTSNGIILSKTNQSSLFWLMSAHKEDSIKYLSKLFWSKHITTERLFIEHPSIEKLNPWDKITSQRTNSSFNPKTFFDFGFKGSFSLT